MRGRSLSISITIVVACTLAPVFAGPLDDDAAYQHDRNRRNAELKKKIDDYLERAEQKRRLQWRPPDREAHKIDGAAAHPFRSDGTTRIDTARAASSPPDEPDAKPGTNGAVDYVLSRILDRRLPLPAVCDPIPDDPDHAWCPVVKRYERATNELYRIQYAGGGRVDTTWSHRFFIQGAGWIEARELRPGQVSVTSDGRRAVIASVARVELPAAITVYNLKVAGLNNFYVHTNGLDILVHNDNYAPENVALPGGEAIEGNADFYQGGTEYASIPAPGPGYHVNGVTTPEFDFVVKAYRDTEGKVRLNVETFDTFAYVTINANNTYNDISEFKDYYENNLPYDESFNTEQGVIVHEQMHVEEYRAAYKTLRPAFLQDIANIRADSAGEAARLARARFEKFKTDFRRLTRSEHSATNAEWDYYRKAYEEHLKKSKAHSSNQ